MKEVEQVRKMYVDQGLTARRIAIHFLVTPGSISNLVSLHGFKKQGNSGQFQKGKTPHNKGKPHPYGKETQFDGSNAANEGAIRVRKKKEGDRKVIKIGGKWVLLHRHIYMAANPEFKGVVRFVDGDPMNCSLENLKGVSRKDLMLDNSVPPGPRKKSIQMRAAMSRKYRRKAQPS